MNYRTLAIVAVFSCMLITPGFAAPLLLDSQTLGKLAVPLISIGGSVVAGKVISDYLEGRGVLGIQAFPAVHTDALIPGRHAPVLLASPVKALPLAHGKLGGSLKLAH